MPHPSFNPIQTDTTLTAFIERRRPPEHIRAMLDFGFRIDGQSIILFEIRPTMSKPARYIELPYAKTTFVKARGYWRVYWLRASGKWDPYEPVPTVDTLGDFLALVEEDAYHCFFG